ncbi:MAG: ABC transporter permease [Planctomycetota bacterium]|nr:ABC transporter permease [Planctomycetota bacterium]
MGLLGDPLGGIGRWALRLISRGAGVAGLGYATLKAFFLEKGRGRQLVWQSFLRQVYFTAAQAIPLLTLASVCVGTVVFFIAAQLLGGLGLAAHIRPSSEMFLRELMPLITILVIIGRSGTAMVTEIGTMKINREDQILDAMAINMDYFVIFPRLLGMVASLLVLNLYVFAVSFHGGEFMARSMGLLSESAGRVPLLELMGTWDLPMLALKSILFGTAVALLACHYGLSVRLSPTEVPQMATRAVISSIFVCLVLNLVCTLFISGAAW